MKDIKKLTLYLIKKIIKGACSSALTGPELVFLMVYIRKFLDSDKRYVFPLIRFYCDWVVHTKKDKITPEIKKIATLLENPQNITNFLEMSELRREFIIFLRKFKLPIIFAEDEINWHSFCSMLFGTIAEQPLNNPTPNIEFICFKLTDWGPCGLEIKFKNRKRPDCYACYVFPFVNLAVRHRKSK